MSLKRQARQRRHAAKREARHERWRQIRCFWTWPLAHEPVNFASDGQPADLRCVACGKDLNPTPPARGHVRV